MPEQHHELEELNVTEMDQVGGGIAIVGSVIFFTALKGILGFSSAAATGFIASDYEGNNPDGPSGPQVSQGFGGGSDIRLKKNIRSEGEIAHLGLKVYSWEYKNAPGERFVGVMAQELLERKDLSHAVFTFHEGPFEGFYGVDYAALGLRCLPEKAFDGTASLILNKAVLVDA